jgi:23S rRNA pseudouridine1911/1915/1917 synthase
MANMEATRRMRLDSFVAQEKPRISRAFAAKLIENGQVLVNGKPEKPGYRLHEHDTVSIDFDEDTLGVVPDIDLPILYEDNDVVVVNKPEGVISHARGLYWDEPSVASFIRQRNVDLVGERAGIVHRLDRATSGVMICAKNPATMKFLQKQFADRKVTKTYVAVVEGQLLPEEAVVNIPIERNPKAPSSFRVGPNGKPATTYYKVLEQGSHYGLIQLQPKTGRTHQLRVHLQKLGHPIVGDPLYGRGKLGDRLFLHAKSLTIRLPSGEEKTFEAKTPEIFNQQIEL